MKTNRLSEKRTKRTLFPYLALTIVSLFLASCGGSQNNTDSNQTAENTEATTTESSAAAAVDTKAHSDSKGVGKFTEVKIEALNTDLAKNGETVFTAKCSACHKTTDQKVVGPGLKGVTERRTPEWIMNMITNPTEMTKSDPVAKALLEEHLTQMTFQNVTDDETRQILEFLRQNDGAK
ncbi:cytochrome c [Solitalea sp. MAHUQ-68]|uniref:Cytochrome c n=1 Tax=Solitalea agri TaxID=2953739 RepID=A0A9X2F443_9SPHI|nr:cytochrome c [Solitalea agri]MCO4293946.1 cytochrome c [Solitalea agri]